MSATEMADPDQALSASSLRDELQASGAKPNSRLSDVSRYMLDHYDELHALKVVDGYSWQAIAAVLARRAELNDTLGRPVSVDVAKLAWSRINRRRRGAAMPRAATVSRPAAASAPEPRGEGQLSMPLQSTDRDALPVDPDPAGFTIRPARPLGATPGAPRGQTHHRSETALLSEEEIDQRVAALAKRQGGARIPPPEVL